MHRCWGIGEIASRIIGECGPHSDEEYGSSSRGASLTLYALVRTCHSLQEYALDALWRRQDSLVPLIKCLPGDLWEVIAIPQWDEPLGKPSGSPTRQLRLVCDRPMRPEDWTRFDYYAPRIRSLIPCAFDREGPPYRAAEILDTLRAARDQPILPNLSYVAFRRPLALPFNAISFLESVAPATLSEVNLTLFRGIVGSNLSETLPGLARLLPAVRKALFRVPDKGVAFETIINTLTLWRELHTLELRLSAATLWGADTAATENAFQSMTPLGSDLLPNLAELKLFVESSILVHGRGARANKPTPFHALRALTVSAGETMFISAMVEDLDFSYLRELRADIFDGVVLETLPGVLAASTFSHTLELLEIHSYSYDSHPPNATSMRFTGSQLRPLARLHRLRSVALSIRGLPSTIETNDDDWELFARAWPHLQSLSVADSRGSENNRTPGRPTLLSLVHLARHCPELRDAEMTIRLQTKHIRDTLPLQTRLKRLNLLYSTCEDVSAAAECLARMFPHLAAISRFVPDGVAPYASVESDSDLWVGEGVDFKEAPWNELLQQVAHQHG